MKISMSVQGEKEVRAELAKASIRYPNALAAAFYSEGVGIYNEARKRVPEDTGYLRDSGYVTKPKQGSSGANIGVEVGFGAPHATLQHENEKYRHSKGEAKYLQKALDSLSSGMLQRVAAQTRRNIEAGIQSVTTLVPSRKGSRKRGRMTRASKSVGRSRK